MQLPIEAETSRSAWTGATAGEASQWQQTIPAELIAALLDQVAKLPAGQPLEALRLEEVQRQRWAEYVEPARRELEGGRGFVILDRLPVERMPQREAIGVYWLLGQLLGEPVVQNVHGTLLYDVRDTGQKLAEGARFSVTSYESSFHTDNSFGDSIVDYVGLLCLQDAQSGGISQNVSGHAVLRVLREEQPGALDVLTQPFHVDRRGGTNAGESPTAYRPVVDEEQGQLVLRYLRHWIEVGHEKVEQPLSAEQRQALDTLDAVAARPELRVQFALSPGQIYFINNRWILHNRTAFTDHSEPERKRHLVRLWLGRRSDNDRSG
jgi:alpha-ketoglutarate-dependent taurine dioxygenase